MTQLCITIKCFEQYYLTNTIILLKKLHFLFISKKKAFKIKNLKQKKLTLNADLKALQLKNENLPLYSSISLPKKRKLFTILRSPHIDKKSREQFEFKSYKKKLFFGFMDSDIKKCFAPLLIFLIKNSDFPGVELEISFSYSTILKKN